MPEPGWWSCRCLGKSMVEAMQLGEAPPTLIETTPTDPSLDERTMAILAHVLQIVGLWIAPLIIFVVKRESKFVSFHALQALLLQVLYLCLMGIGMFLWFGAVVLTMMAAQPPGTRLHHRHFSS